MIMSGNHTLKVLKKWDEKDICDTAHLTVYEEIPEGFVSGQVYCFSIHPKSWTVFTLADWVHKTNETPPCLLVANMYQVPTKWTSRYQYGCSYYTWFDEDFDPINWDEKPEHLIRFWNGVIDSIQTYLHYK